MLMKCILIFLGGYVSIITIFCYDTYQDNAILKQKVELLEERLKKYE